MGRSGSEWCAICSNVRSVARRPVDRQRAVAEAGDSGRTYGPCLARDVGEAARRRGAYHSRTHTHCRAWLCSPAHPCYRLLRWSAAPPARELKNSIQQIPGVLKGLESPTARWRASIHSTATRGSTWAELVAQVWSLSASTVAPITRTSRRCSQVRRAASLCFGAQRPTSESAFACPRG